MATNRALTKDHQVTGHDVRAFNGNGYRVRAIADTQVVARAKRHCFTAVHVHCIAKQHALKFGQLAFQDGRGYRWLFAMVDQVSGLVHRGCRNVGQ